MFPKDLLSMTEFNQLSLHLAEDHYLARIIKDKGNSIMFKSDSGIMNRYILFNRAIFYLRLLKLTQ